MSDEPRVAAIKIGDAQIRVTDPLAVQPVFAEFMTEVRVVNNVVHLSLASVVVDGSGDPEARVVARIRMTVETATDIQGAINHVIDTNRAALAVAKQTAN